MYADDIAMLYHDRSNDDLKGTMKRDFNTISTWAPSNNLSINNDNEVMFIKQNDVDDELFGNCVVIENVFFLSIWILILLDI
jgi:hypothetical protein